VVRRVGKGPPCRMKAEPLVGEDGGIQPLVGGAEEDLTGVVVRLATEVVLDVDRRLAEFPRGHEEHDATERPSDPRLDWGLRLRAGHEVEKNHVECSGWKGG